MQAIVLGHPIFNRNLLLRLVIVHGRGERGRGMGGWAGGVEGEGGRA